ncbi:MAG: hypothetical protein H6729_07995 [Deltaproteobacteria bacterium]|nr:hypothetical protein [Deltaproteobacteria bacterium]
MTAKIANNPTMALILCAHTRAMGAMEELSALAKDQQLSNEQLKRLRAFENMLRGMRADHVVGRRDLEKLVKEAEALNALGVRIDISTQIEFLTKSLKLVNAPENQNSSGSDSSETGVDTGGNKPYRDEMGNVCGSGVDPTDISTPTQPPKDAQASTTVEESDRDYLREDRDGPYECWKTHAQNLDAIRDAIGECKENVKGEASNRELDIQRITQEVSSAMQLQSNLAKSDTDTIKGTIANIRA